PADPPAEQSVGHLRRLQRAAGEAVRWPQRHPGFPAARRAHVPDAPSAHRDRLRTRLARRRDDRRGPPRPGLRPPPAPRRGHARPRSAVSRSSVAWSKATSRISRTLAGVWLTVATAIRAASRAG